MTEKVREYIDLVYGMGKLRELIDEKAEWNKDERVTEYTTMAMSALEGMTEEEAKYLDIATTALKAMAKALLTVVEARGKGGISELAAKIVAKAGISGHDCDNCSKVGKCDMEAMIRAEKANHIDAQVEENKRLREALDHIANDKKTPSQPWMEYLHLKRIAREVLKPDTEEGHWDCVCTNPTPSSPSVEGKRKCLFCAREMVYRTALKPDTEEGES